MENTETGEAEVVVGIGFVRKDAREKEVFMR